MSNSNSEILDQQSFIVSSRRTDAKLTKYEKARILGLRATQISKGAKPTVEITEGMTDALKIAEKELKFGNIPLIVRRYMPDGTFEDWSLNELKNHE